MLQNPMPPREPTEEMMQAGLNQSSADSEWADVYSIWVDMWTAGFRPTVQPEPAIAPRVAAAAPEMLAALRRVHETLEALGDLPSMRADIAAVIAKAGVPNV